MNQGVKGQKTKLEWIESKIAICVKQLVLTDENEKKNFIGILKSRVR
jgi:hypothetical protein